MTHISSRDKESAHRSALITGGGVRVGAAITRALARAGFRIAVHYHQSSEAAKRLSEDFTATDRKHVLLQADLTRPRACASLVDRAAEALDGLSLLVNSAAILVDDSADTVDLAKMKLLNVDAPAACLEAAAPHLERCSGSAINISDTAGIEPYKLHQAYSRTQSALLGMTARKALDLAPAGVRVNAICPATVLPPASYTDEMVDRLAKAIPLGRIGRPEDIADAVVYLALAPFVTGQILCVDGGLVLAAQNDRKKKESKERSFDRRP